METCSDIIRERDLLAKALQDILQASADINKRLDDPNDDGGATDTKVPDANDFDELDATVCDIAKRALAAASR